MNPAQEAPLAPQPFAGLASLQGVEPNSLGPSTVLRTTAFGAYFTQNAGQIANDAIRFEGSAAGLHFGFATSSIFVTVNGPANTGGVRTASTVRIVFEGAHPVEPRGIGALPHKNNYFIGSDPAKWRVGVPNFQDVVYPDLYDGVDLIFHIGPQGVKYDLELEPGTDPGVVHLQFEGVSSLLVDGLGNLVAQTPAGMLPDAAPTATQVSSSPSCAYALVALTRATFSCSGVDPARPLLIDPLFYSTLIGGDDFDAPFEGAVAVDANGSAYITGSTASSNFPATAGANDTTLGATRDAYVAKFAPDGSRLEWATYLGGAVTEDDGMGIWVNASGEAFVTGQTASSDFPTTPGAADRVLDNWDGFVTKLGANGDVLLYSTFLGGTSFEGGYSVNVDRQGAAIVTGYTGSSDFPATIGAFDTTYNGSFDCFAAKLNTAGSALDWATFLGGGAPEGASGSYSHGCLSDLDVSGNVYITGWTDSGDFTTTPGAFQRSHAGGNEDAFITKLNASGTALDYSSFLGGNSPDYGYAVAVDSMGAAYVTGLNSFGGFPVTSGAYDTAHNENTGTEWGDCFVAKFNASGARLDYATYVGTNNGNEGGFDIAVDGAGVVYFVGLTESNAFPTTAGSFSQNYSGGRDGFLASIDRNGTSLRFGAFLGGSGSDAADSVALGPNGTVFVQGHSASVNFPATNTSFDATLNGPMDGFVAKFGPPSEPRLAAGLAGNASAVISWSAPAIDGGDAVRSFELLGGIDPANLGVVRSVPGNTFTLNETNLTNGVVYYYRVVALNVFGTGNLSALSVVVPFANPGAPLSFSATGGVQSARLTWSPPSVDGGRPIVNYTVYRWLGNASKELIASLPNVTAHIDVGLANGTTYCYEVLAVNAAGEGAASVASCTRTFDIPSAPLNLLASAGNAQVSLQWAAPAVDGGAPIMNYSVYRRDGGGTENLITSTVGSENFLDTGLTNGVNYTYRISAANAVGEGPPSLPSWAIPITNATEPLSLLAVPGLGSISLSWSPPSYDGASPLTGYDVYRWNATAAKALQPFAGNTTSFADIALGEATQYCYEVHALNGAGQGPASASACATTFGRPSAPGSLTAVAAPGSVSLNWAAPASNGGAAVLQYTLYRRAGAGAEVIVGAALLGTAYFDSNVTNGTLYAYRVSATNAVGEGATSGPAQATPLGVPGPPLGFMVTSGPVFRVLNLNWTPPDVTGGASVTQYRVFRGTNDTNISQLIGTTSNTTFRDNDVLPGVVYWYAVVAVNSVGPGPRALTDGATPPNEPPSVVGSPPTESADNTPVVFQFMADDSDDTEGFTFAKTSGPVWIVVRSNGSLEITPPAGVHGRFFYNVSATDAHGSTGPTRELSFVAAEPAAPRVPADFPWWLLLLLIAAGAAGAFVVLRNRRGGPSDVGEPSADRTPDTSAPPEAAVGAAIIAPAAGTAPAAGLSRALAAAAPAPAGAARSRPMVAAAPPRTKYLVEDVFLLYRDGRSILAQGGLRADAEEDPEVVGSMLVAVQDFVKDAFKKGTPLDKMAYGDDAVLIERGDYTILAVTVYGQPDREFRDFLTQTVRTVEGTFAGLIEHWDGNKSALVGLEAILAPLWLANGDLTREDVVLATTAREVQVLSGVEFFQGYVRLKVAVVNNTTSVITGVVVDVDCDTDVLRLHKTEPSTYRATGTKVLVGVLNTGEKKTVAYYFDPQICTVSTLDGACRYKDAEGTTHTVHMKPRKAEVVCPLFFTKETANTAMLKRLIETEAKQYDVRGYSYKAGTSEGELRALFEGLKSAVLAHDVLLVRAHERHRPFHGEAWLYGKTQLKGYSMVIRAVVDEEKRRAEFFVASTTMRSVTGLLAELHHSFSETARERLSDLNVQPLFDESLKNTYADPAAVARMVGEADPGETEI